MTDRNPIESKLRSRRRLLAGAAAAGALLGIPAIVRAQGDRKIVTTGYGGVYEQHFKTFVIDPWEKKTGAKVELYKTGGANQWLTNSIVNKDKPEIDIPFLSLPLTHQAIRTEGVFMDLDAKLIPNSQYVDPAFFDYYDRRAIGFNYAPYGLTYRTDLVKNKPTSWGDLWKPEYAGKVLLPDTTSGGAEETVVIAAMLNGGSLENLEPGWAALKRLKPNVMRFFKNNNEPIPIWQRGEAAIGGWYSARAFQLKDGGTPVEFVAPSEGAPVGVLSFHLAKNSPNRDLALDFINFALGKEPQEGFGNAIEYGVCNRLAEMKGRAKERVAPHSQLMRIDWRKTDMSKIAERWRREVTS